MASLYIIFNSEELKIEKIYLSHQSKSKVLNLAHHFKYTHIKDTCVQIRINIPRKDNKKPYSLIVNFDTRNYGYFENAFRNSKNQETFWDNTESSEHFEISDAYPDIPYIKLIELLMPENCDDIFEF